MGIFDLFNIDVIQFEARVIAVKLSLGSMSAKFAWQDVEKVYEW